MADQLLMLSGYDFISPWEKCPSRSWHSSTGASRAFRFGVRTAK